MQGLVTTDGQRNPDRVLVMRLPRELTHERAAELMRTLEDALNEGSTRIALDLSAVVTLSDNSLGVIIRGRKFAQEAGGDVRLFAVPRPIGRFLHAMGLDNVFQQYKTEAEVVQSFEM